VTLRDRNLARLELCSRVASLASLFNCPIRASAPINFVHLVQMRTARCKREVRFRAMATEFRPHPKKTLRQRDRGGRLSSRGGTTSREVVPDA
jgi:hypothetical protein